MTQTTQKNEITYNIEETLCTLSQYGDESKLLTLTSWNGHPAKLDLRNWKKNPDGSLSPRKGITLSEREGRELGRALYLHFERINKA